MDRAVLSENELQNEPIAPDSEAPEASRIVEIVTSARTWASANWMRSIATGSVMLLLVVGTIAVWAYLANIAIQADRYTLGEALAALDAGDYEEARILVRQMLNSSFYSRAESGGPLYVLGAIKAYDAESHGSPDRRRTEYLVASRYLREADAYGFPRERKKHGLYLLGKSHLESLQWDAGIESLEKALLVETKPETPEKNLEEKIGLTLEIHQLLAQALTSNPIPQLDRALVHNRAVLENKNLSLSTQADALLQQAEILSGLARYSEAMQPLAQILQEPGLNKGLPRARALMMQGQVLLEEVETMQNEAASRFVEPPAKIAMQIDQALKYLQQAQELDQFATEVTPRSMVLLGLGHQLLGKMDVALRQYVQTRQQYGDTPAGLAATLAEADILRLQNQPQESLVGYRRVLESVTNADVYHNPVLSWNQLRRRIRNALADFNDRGLYDESLALLDHFLPLFSHTKQAHLLAITLRRQGNAALKKGAEDNWQASKWLEAGRAHHREAGTAFERLADLRFSTKHYPEDLWDSVESNYRGQSYTSMIRVLDQYLAIEPELRNAQALLRSGQAHLALGHVTESIAALEECIEFHPYDTSTYQARIDCAKAHWYQGNQEEAERLLRSNLYGSALKPSSPEWKDSLFELGALYHETGRYAEAIRLLEEAVERYPDDRQTLLSQYLIAESNRHAAELPRQRLQVAKTASEQEKNKQLAEKHWRESLHRYKVVQRKITLNSRDIYGDPLQNAMLRNCYMFEGAVLFHLEQYDDAIKAYSNVSSLYQHEPFVLETFIQISHCWHRLDRKEKAKGAIQQAQIALENLPDDVDFMETTSFSREEWTQLLTAMSR